MRNEIRNGYPIMYNLNMLDINFAHLWWCLNTLTFRSSTITCSMETGHASQGKSYIMMYFRRPSKTLDWAYDTNGLKRLLDNLSQINAATLENRSSGFRPGPTQTDLCSYRTRTEA